MGTLSCVAAEMLFPGYLLLLVVAGLLVGSSLRVDVSYFLPPAEKGPAGGRKYETSARRLGREGAAHLRIQQAWLLFMSLPVPDSIAIQLCFGS